jgi:hypothetical protein
MQKRNFHQSFAVACVLSLGALLSSCAEQSSNGVSTPIPTVIVNCTSSACRQNASNAVVTVLITQFDCDPANSQFGTVSSSFRVNCTISGGCYGTATSWVTIQNTTASTISDGTYTVCGRIDYLNTPFIYTDDSTANVLSIPIRSTGTSPVSLTSWVGP